MAQPVGRSSAIRDRISRFFVAVVCFLFITSLWTRPVYAAVNIEPTLDPVSNQAVLEDSGTTTVLLTGISAGAGDVGQNLTVSASSSNPLILPNPTITYTSPETTASLTFTPVQNMYGEVEITITVLDDGGTADGGDDRLSQNFSVTITPVNDPPLIYTFNKIGDRGKSLVFSKNDFQDNYYDNENSPIASIKIITLPTTGVLSLDGVTILSDTEIPISMVDKLEFVPPFYWYGSTSFSWTASDGQDYATLPATVNLTYQFSLLSSYLPLIIAPPPPPQPWGKPLTENFEGAFPGPWHLFSSWYYDGFYYDVTTDISWGKRNCHAASGSFGGWAVGGGSIGSTKTCKDSYPDDIETWMIYGPIDLTQVKDAWMSLKIWSDTENGYDRMGWGVSLDNDTFYGRFYSGNSGGWITDTIDLKNVYSLGNVTGASQVWIGIWFESDSSDIYFEEGVAIDNLVLSTCSSAIGCTGTPLVSGMSELPNTFQVMPTMRSLNKKGLLPSSDLPKNIFFDPSVSWPRKTDLR